MMVNHLMDFIRLFSRHDIAVSSVDPATKAVMEACIAENEADKHASNLKVGLHKYSPHRMIILSMQITKMSFKMNIFQIEFLKVF